MLLSDTAIHTNRGRRGGMRYLPNMRKLLMSHKKTMTHYESKIFDDEMRMGDMR